MAFSEKLVTISGQAAADLSARQYRFVKQNSAGQYAVATAGAEVDGITQNDPAAQGRALTVGVGGISKLELGGTVDEGQYVAAGSNGVGVAAASADFVGAKARTSGVSGDFIAVEIMTQWGRL